MTGKPIVFISSTCYDLTDVRAELRHYLEERGFVVKLSEDVNSAFYVEPTVDSIESCLLNLEQSDVVVCVVDKRYGPCLGDQFDNISATHQEIRRARERKIPTLFFVREFAKYELDQLRGKDSKYDPKYIEKGKYTGKTTKEKQLVNFVQEIISLHDAKKQEHSNWADTFKSSVDLKLIIYRRLVDLFPRNNCIQAMAPDHFLHANCEISQNVNSITFLAKWGSLKTAVHVKHGLRIDDKDMDIKQSNTLSNECPIYNSHEWNQLIGKKYMAVWCEYSNLFGDRYRIEVELNLSQDAFVINPGIPVNGVGSRTVTRKEERVFVLFDEQWIEVMNSTRIDKDIPVPTIQ